MSLGRSIRRKQAKAEKKAAKKQAKAKMKHAQEVIEGMPTECATCYADFDRTNPDNLDAWHIAVTSETVLLTCPKCVESSRW